MDPDLLARIAQPISPLEIKEWSRRASLEAHEPAIQKGIVNRLFGNISVLYKEVLQTFAEKKDGEVDITKGVYRRLESGYMGFLTWGSDYSVEDGKLDILLEGSARLQYETLRIMMSICATLTDELIPLMHPDKESTSAKVKSLAELTSTMEDAFRVLEDTRALDDLSDDSDASSSWSNPSLEEVIGTLKNDVECLMDMGPQLEEPLPSFSTDDDSQETIRGDRWDPVKHFSERIRTRFPKCHPTLVAACSKAVYSALLRLHGERERAATSKPPRDAGEGSELPDSAFFSGSSLTLSLQQPQGRISAHDSLAGSSIAATVLTFATEDGTKRARFPAQPKDINIGELFHCVACGQRVAKSSSPRAWKRHLLSDLRPWICCQVSCPCDHKPFETKDQWLRHLRAQHHLHPEWDDKACPFCACSVPEGGAATICHVELHLQEISLMALSSQAETDEEGESDASDPGSGAGRQRSEGEPGLAAGGSPVLLENIRDHPVHKSAKPRADGLWHCPWEGEDCCTHEATILQSEFNGFIAYHLDSFTCKVRRCETNGRAFSSFECLRLHEQEAHGMHRGNGRPYLCTSKGCGRSIPGNGFANRWVLEDHIRVVHGNIEGLPPLPPDEESDCAGEGV